MKRSISVKIVLCGIFAALTCIFAMISIPFGPVPINMAHIAIFLSAAFLGPYLGFLSQIIYILIGLIGLPVFSNFTGGLSHLIGPTGGFIMAYPIVAYVSGALFQKLLSKSTYKLIIVIYIGWFIEYVMGVSYYSYIMDTPLYLALSVCVAPFILGDLCKSIACIILIKKLQKFKRYLEY